ncbi:MAG: sulfurtransferase TusA family protein [Gammaproteobacteria bacterium]|nr:sulfurtransferase TusA family protein [Gammaproteobacteria bacterium]
MAHFDQELDTSGLNCPMPVMQTKKALKNLAVGQILHLIATDPGTKDDIPGLVEQLGCTIESSAQDGGKYHFHIRKG